MRKYFLQILLIIFSVFTQKTQGAPVQLTFGAGNDTEATWSPDGRWIAFQSDRSGSDAIYLLDTKTEKVQRWSTGSGNACYPAWSPDGSNIVYVYANITNTAFEGIKNGYNLYIRSAHGKGVARRLTSGLFVDTTPVFNPDGKSILFSSTRGGGEETSRLYSIPVKGGSPQLFLQTSAPARSSWVEPDLSSDGQYFAASFSSGVGLWSVYIGSMNNPADRIAVWSNLRAILYSPAWSPVRNDTIAFTGFSAPDKGWNIYLRHGENGDITRLTDSIGNSRSPAWSPDGSKIVYENNRTGDYKLYLINVEPDSTPDRGIRINSREISASSENDSARFAFDGKIDEDAPMWICVGTNQYCQVVFDTPREIKEVEVYSGITAYWKNPSGAQSVKAFKVEGLIDGKWTELGMEVKNIPSYAGEPVSSFFASSSFKPVQVNGVRVVITATGDTLRRMKSPYKPCVAPDKAVTYVREIKLK